jgi:hypothetical protein
MASATVAGPWPDGTVVSAYGRGNEVAGAPPKAAPAALTTAVASSGQVTFVTGLADGTDYVAYAQVGGVDRYVEFRTPLPATGTSRVGTHAQRLAAGHVAGRFWKESDTNLVYLDDGVNWIIWKGDGVIRKTADETVNNSAALQDDDHLFLPVEANEVWWFEALLICVGTTTTADFQFTFTGPAGAAAGWQARRDTAGVTPATTPVNVLPLGTALALGGKAGATGVLVELLGQIVNGPTAGNLKLQWAQNTATVEDNKILANSILRVRRVA